MSARTSVGDLLIPRLSDRDVLWLQKLADGERQKELPCISEAMTKKRLMQIRWFLKCRTTTQAVVEALRQGIIR